LSPETKEDREMVKQEALSRLGAEERQDRRHRRRSIRRKAALRRFATLMIAAGVLSACSSAGDNAQSGGAGQTSTSVPTPTAPFMSASGHNPPGRYAFTTSSDLDDSHRITMDVPSGWGGSGDGHVISKGPGQGISTWVVRNVYADPCAWTGTLLDPPAGSSVDGLVAALAAQKARHASTPTPVTVYGFTGTYMELTTPAGINLADCDGGEFRSWVDWGGARYTEPGQRDMLWILDVDGVPLVIDAALGEGTTRRDRFERTEIVESTQIEPL
jgi:hypothetical protein